MTTSLDIRTQIDARGIAAVDGTLLPKTFISDPRPFPESAYVLVTPAIAARLLTMNTSNRKPKPDRISEYAGYLLRGTFRTTHQGIAIDWNGTLQDGQHRLMAIMKAGVAAVMSISWYCNPENYPHIDRVAGRTIADGLTNSGIKDRGGVASAARYVVLYSRHATSSTGSQARVPDDTLRDFILSHPGLQDAVRIGHSLARIGCMTRTAGGAAHFLIAEAHPEVNFDDWLNGVLFGANLQLRDPRLALRNALTTNHCPVKGSPLDLMKLYIKAWHGHMDGRPMRYLRTGAYEYPRP